MQRAGCRVYATARSTPPTMRVLPTTVQVPTHQLLYTHCGTMQASTMLRNGGQPCLDARQRLRPQALPVDSAAERCWRIARNHEFCHLRLAGTGAETRKSKVIGRLTTRRLSLPCPGSRAPAGMQCSTGTTHTHTHARALTLGLALGQVKAEMRKMIRPQTNSLRARRSPPSLRRVFSRIR